jgi:ABC-type bacteriocin/lantibiotic exporter with double-glycine peptidase domain
MILSAQLLIFDFYEIILPVVVLSITKGITITTRIHGNNSNNNSRRKNNRNNMYKNTNQNNSRIHNDNKYNNMNNNIKKNNDCQLNVGKRGTQTYGQAQKMLFVYTTA